MMKWITKDRGLPFVLFVFMVLFPWITLRQDLMLSESEHLLYGNNVDGFKDLFLFGKVIFIVVVAIIVAAILLCGYLKDKKKFKVGKTAEKVIIAAAFYLFLVVLSVVLAKYKDIAWRGNLHSLEGPIVIAAYLVIFYGAFRAFSMKENLVYIKIASMALGLITIVLTAVDRLIAPISKFFIGEAWESDYGNMTSLTFFNPVYLAMFLAMLIPLVFGLYLFEREMRLKVASGVIFAGLLICNLTVRSTMSLYVTIAEIVILIIVRIIMREKSEGKSMARYGAYFVAPLVLAVAFLVINLASDNYLVKIMTGTGLNAADPIHKESYYEIRDIKYADGQIEVTGKDSTFSIILDENKNIAFKGNPEARYEVRDNKIVFEAPYHMISAGLNGNLLAVDFGYQEPIYFGLTDSGVVPVRSDGTVVTDMSGNGLGMDNLYHLATGRGFFWVNSLPILKNTIVTGHGTGTFGLYFNQHDYVGMLNTHGSVNSVLEHPHNLYIQTAAESGIVALVAMLAMWLIVAFAGIRALVKKQVADENRGLLVAVLVAVFGFMVCGIATDSMVTVTPLFYVLLGALLGVVSLAGKRE